jgi:hypothetical protein
MKAVPPLASHFEWSSNGFLITNTRKFSSVTPVFIRKVPGSHFGEGTIDYFEFFRGFPRSLQANAGVYGDLLFQILTIDEYLVNSFDINYCMKLKWRRNISKESTINFIGFNITTAFPWPRFWQARTSLEYQFWVKVKYTPEKGLQRPVLMRCTTKKKAYVGLAPNEIRNWSSNMRLAEDRIL